MARSLETIQDQMLEKLQGVDQLNALEVLTTQEKQTLPVTSTSRVARWRTFIFIVAFAIWVLERIFDTYSKEVDIRVRRNEIHNFSWYRERALNFQYGQALVSETDFYDNSNLTAVEIADRRIIKQVSVDRLILGGRGFLEIKLAKEFQGNLVPLNSEELEAFSAYMFVVADAGTYINYVSLPHDDLRLELDIYYDPLIIWQDGTRKDGTNNTPVQDAINNFLSNLQFNGELILTKLTDHLQEVEGVKIPVIKEAFSKFGNNDYQLINETYLARAGYMQLDLVNTTINYIAREL